jgi:hypothetical protein
VGEGKEKWVNMPVRVEAGLQMGCGNCEGDQNQQVLLEVRMNGIWKSLVSWGRGTDSSLLKTRPP